MRWPERAKEEVIERFEAPVLATNREAIRLLARLGKTTYRSRGREVDVHVELSTEAAGARNLSASPTLQERQQHGSAPAADDP